MLMLLKCEAEVLAAAGPMISDEEESPALDALSPEDAVEVAEGQVI